MPEIRTAVLKTFLDNESSSLDPVYLLSCHAFSLFYSKSAKIVKKIMKKKSRVINNLRGYS